MTMMMILITAQWEESMRSGSLSSIVCKHISWLLFFFSLKKTKNEGTCLVLLFFYYTSNPERKKKPSEQLMLYLVSHLPIWTMDSSVCSLIERSPVDC